MHGCFNFNNSSGELIFKKKISGFWKKLTLFMKKESILFIIKTYICPICFIFWLGFVKWLTFIWWFVLRDSTGPQQCSVWRSSGHVRLSQYSHYSGHHCPLAQLCRRRVLRWGFWPNGSLLYRYHCVLHIGLVHSTETPTQLNSDANITKKTQFFQKTFDNGCLKLMYFCHLFLYWNLKESVVIVYFHMF